MTERLYYQDSALLEFKARIVEIVQSGGNHYTVLDRSAFYPTSGGQLHDTGTLNGVEIIDVVEADGNDIRHISTQVVGRVGDSVTGLVEKERRWRNRQVHTAQHILSQVFTRLCDAETVSVHLGEEYAAIELATGSLSDSLLEQAECAANEAVRDNLPVEIIFAAGDEIEKLPLRKVPKRTGRIRVVKIGEFECSACGGTHCNCTAEVGMLKILATERIRNRVLVKFLAGSQVLLDYGRRFRVTNDLTRVFTCHLNDLGPKTEKLLAEHKQQHQEIVRLQKEMLPLRVDELVALARKVGGKPVVTRLVTGMDSSIINALASQTAEKINGIVVLHAENRLTVAASDTSGLHAGRLVKRFAEETGLRGGGSEYLAQIGNADRDKFDHFINIIEALIDDA